MTSCSAACDYEVQKKVRLCDSPPPSTIFYECLGPSEIVKVCAQENCQGVNEFTLLTFVLLSGSI